MNSLFSNWVSTLKKALILLVLSILLPTFSIHNYTMAAEKVYASYSALELSIPVKTLEIYAKTGSINGYLGIYQHFFPLEQLEELREILNKPIKINPVIASQLLNTQQGEFLLHRLAQLIKNQSPQSESGFYALRSALILAAGEPEGLTLINLLRNYPKNSIHIDLAHSLEIAGELERLLQDTKAAIATVTQQSDLEAATIPDVKFSELPNIQNSGKFTQRKYTIKFFDASRDRTLTTDIYVPDVQTPAPIIVISHGLGLDSSNFRYIAQHLSSHGFVVVVPNHPGSDAKQLNSLISNHTGELAAPSEFIDRPLDIKFILDQLEKSNQIDSRFQNRLNLQQVGVFGQSFGGYTALALAGAKINFQQLAKDCQPQALEATWNMSLLLQCHALGVKSNSGQEYNLQDERVKSVIAVNPITSSVFGQEGLRQIQTPVMIVGSSEDTIAPVLYEQILPFSWFTHVDKYLALLVGGTHFSTIGNSSYHSQQVALPPEMVGDATKARTYINTLSLSFFQTYIAHNSDYSPYLNPTYTKSISSESLGLSLVKSLAHTPLAPDLNHQSQTTKSVKKNFLRFWSKWVIGCWILGCF
ncbi:MAG TPA: alpha/beta hydrolase [Nostocaceae cyanobacterium]|nr:alpha/beta hydrolase [Nostocaceae cyanobacterium]